MLLLLEVKHYISVAHYIIWGMDESHLGRKAFINRLWGFNNVLHNTLQSFVRCYRQLWIKLVILCYVHCEGYIVF